MKNPLILTAIGAIVLIAIVAFVYLKPTSSLEVEAGAIALGIENHGPLNPSTTFSNIVGKLYCFTKITGMNATEKSITHKWYYGNKLQAEIPLKIKTKNYRTYSNKTIPKEMTGDWKVEVTAPSGKVIKTLEFVIQ